MKRHLFGYRKSDVDIVLESLRKENEGLNSTIITLQNQLKNNVGEKNAKSILLEDRLKKLENDNLHISMEKDELAKQIIALTKELEDTKLQNNKLATSNKYLSERNEELSNLVSKLQTEIRELGYMDETAATLDDSTDSLKNLP